MIESLVSGFFCVRDYYVDGGSVFNLGLGVPFHHSYCQSVYYVVFDYYVYFGFFGYVFFGSRYCFYYFV